MNKKMLVTATLIALIVGFAVATNWYRGAEAERVETIADESTNVLVPGHAMSLGPEDAQVVLVEFFDPACETCAMFHKPVKDLLKQYPERLRLVLRYAPFHHGSEDVAKMLEAARLQGKYWEALEVMFATQRRWASHHHPQPELLWELLPAAGLELDMERMRQDFAGFQIDSIVQKDIADAATLGIRKTPGFLVNGRQLPSFGLAQLHQLVAEEMAAKYTK
ncbi:MAG: disulfide bond formation protein DsbA [Rickettsiales bacterium]|nr:disulfide bond formation protein DsbA [Rickettsiales bacterium]